MKSINLILFKNKISFFKKINLTKTKKKKSRQAMLFLKRLKNIVESERKKTKYYRIKQKKKAKIKKPSKSG
jgi:hypothetical protein